MTKQCGSNQISRWDEGKHSEIPTRSRLDNCPFFSTLHSTSLVATFSSVCTYPLCFFQQAERGRRPRKAVNLHNCAVLQFLRNFTQFLRSFSAILLSFTRFLRNSYAVFTQFYSALRSCSQLFAVLTHFYAVLSSSTLTLRCFTQFLCIFWQFQVL